MQAMRAVLQRVTQARVEVEGAVTGAIGAGLLVLVAASKTDTPADADFLAAKIAGLRIFADSEGKMNLSVAETGGSMLVVSQFTLYGDCRKGRRPSFDKAASTEQARSLVRILRSRRENAPEFPSRPESFRPIWPCR